MHLVENVYWYPWQGRGNNCNSFLLDGEKTILFDPGHVHNELGERCLEILTRGISADGFKLEQVDIILLTHGHPDHCEAAGVIRELNGAQIAIHEEDKVFLQVFQQRYKQAGREMPSLDPDFILQEGELVLGQENPERVEVIHTPGHSPGSVTFHLLRQAALVTGDCVFQNSIGRADLPGGNMQTLDKSVARLAKINGVEMLLPGHMNVVRGRENVEKNFTLIRSMFFR